MSIQRQREEIETFFFEQFGALHPTVPVTGENADFNPPENAPWLRISLQVAEQFETCIGSNDSYRTEGIIGVQIFTPLSEGSFQANVLADSALKIFRTATNTDMDGVTILRSAITFSGQDEGFYQLNVFTDYRGQD